MNKGTLEKVFEYASKPVQGTMSRKLRKDIALQVNEGPVYSEAVLFLGEEFVRVTCQDDGKTMNTYYDWEMIASVRTIGPAS
ncbi:hypothetical protein [Desulfovibrio ferrophilus]|uniref:Uncharacterized protein n=1 Tax=Desulfovibrio ferrophilus TaxID=241368 RepID=A0A2Z6AY71_9BACT|nr:hypothetical protein [Desulfovibrio ferrophilus]BBD08207.1 uncharacterized protein DFE_1481 [Desulfovibrio ferrophilus]